MKLTLQLSCYNGARYLPFLFASLRRQTFRDWHIHLLDNASDEENRLAIEEAVRASGLPITLYRVETNIGFAGAHNYLFDKHKETSDAVQLLNDDAILEPDYLERVLAFLKSRRRAAAEGRIMRWDFDRRQESDGGKTDIVDTLGLAMDWKGFVRDVGMGERFDASRFTLHASRVLGVSGCLPMYRVAAVREARPDGHLFDPRFIMYKEDVELALRLRAAGWEAAVVHEAVAYHRRSYGTKSFARPKNEAAYFSFRNHWWMLIQHMPLLSAVTNRIGTLPAEAAKIIYWLLTKPSFVVRAVRETWNALPHLLRERAFVFSLRRSRLTHHASPARPAGGRITHHAPHADIAILMVSHNDLSEECLRSVSEARLRTDLKVEVVIADNASRKYRANEFVAPILPDAWVLLRDGDHGFGRSNNRAARQVEADYYFCLNPDTVLMDPDILRKMHDFMRAHPDVGLMAPKIHYFDGRLQETCRRFPKWFMPFIQRTSLGRWAFGQRYAAEFAMRDYDHAESRAVDWVQGSAMFVDGALWRELGGFDDRYWLYFEDIDLCRRIQLKGRRVVYNPGIAMQHAHGKESAKYASLLVNLMKNKEARGHIASWAKYLWKWKFQKLPSST